LDRRRRQLHHVLYPTSRTHRSDSTIRLQQKARCPECRARRRWDCRERFARKVSAILGKCRSRRRWQTVSPWRIRWGRRRRPRWFRRGSRRAGRCKDSLSRRSGCSPGKSRGVRRHKNRSREFPERRKWRNRRRRCCWNPVGCIGAGKGIAEIGAADGDVVGVEAKALTAMP